MFEIRPKRVVLAVGFAAVAATVTARVIAMRREAAADDEGWDDVAGSLKTRSSVAVAGSVLTIDSAAVAGSVATRRSSAVAGSAVTLDSAAVAGSALTSSSA